MRAIVITSIFPPTQAVRAFARLPDWDLIVVGDKKSPREWSCEGVEYLSVERQAELHYKLTGALPFNHYCRKMIGYLRAIERGASVIVDTDDDNAPLPGWSFPAFNGSFRSTLDGEGFVNIYHSYTAAPIWPRGFPLDKLKQSFDALLLRQNHDCNVAIWQGLANGDPDVDAIYRLTDGRMCTFDPGAPIVLGKDTICPINSQNTAFRADAYPLLYLPTTVTFRFTDILRGLIAQPILWRFGMAIGFTEATVFQDRNPHDYVKDFESEVPMYLQTKRTLEVTSRAIEAASSIEDALIRSYGALLEADIVQAEELTRLRAWLDDLAALRRLV